MGKGVDYIMEIVSCDCGTVIDIHKLKSKAYLTKGINVHTIHCPACRGKIKYKSEDILEVFNAGYANERLEGYQSDLKKYFDGEIEGIRFEFTYFKKTINDMWAVTEQNAIDLEREREAKG